jgi:hypothetical protein
MLNLSKTKYPIDRLSGKNSICIDEFNMLVVIPIGNSSLSVLLLAYSVALTYRFAWIIIPWYYRRKSYKPMGLSDYKVYFLHFLVPWDNGEFKYNSIFN